MHLQKGEPVEIIKAEVPSGNGRKSIYVASILDYRPDRSGAEFRQNACPSLDAVPLLCVPPPLSANSAGDTVSAARAWCTSDSVRRAPAAISIV